jgi:hypothetical protein
MRRNDRQSSRGSGSLGPSSSSRASRRGAPEANGRSAHEERLRLLLDEVLAVLERERDLTASLLAQAREMQGHLLADDILELLHAAQTQETHAQQLAQWEYRRLLLTREVGVYVPQLPRLRLSQWANYLPEPYGSRLHAVQVALQRATAELQVVNRQNAALVQRSLRFAQMALGLESSTYHASGGRHQARGGLDSPSLLDKTL